MTTERGAGLSTMMVEDLAAALRPALERGRHYARCWQAIKGARGLAHGGVDADLALIDAALAALRAGGAGGGETKEG